MTQEKQLVGCEFKIAQQGDLGSLVDEICRTVDSITAADYHDNDVHYEVFITAQRPETNNEYAARIQEERAALQRLQEQESLTDAKNRANRYELYKQLAKEFGDKPQD